MNPFALSMDAILLWNTSIPAYNTKKICFLFQQEKYGRVDRNQCWYKRLIQNRFFFFILGYFDILATVNMKRNIFRNQLFLYSFIRNLKNCRVAPKYLEVSVCALKRCFSSSNVSGRSIYIHSSFVINLFCSFGMILLIIITIESWWSVCSMLLKMKLQWISKQFPFLEYHLQFVRA